MLLEFNFKNFKSYRNHAKLSLSAASRLSKAFHVKKVGGERVLPCAVIFGANAGGKSNVYDAFDTMRYYVLNSFGFGGGDAQQFIQKPPRQPFLFAPESNREPTDFEVFFIEKETNDSKTKTWQYGFSFDDTKIIEEWLSYKENGKTANFKTVFTRDGDEIESSVFSEVARSSIKEMLNPETLVVSLGGKLKIPECETVLKAFVSYRTVSFNSPFETFLRSTFFSHWFNSDEKKREDLAAFLATFDPSIKGIETKETPSPKNPDQTAVSIYTVHKASEEAQPIQLPLTSESGGIQKMFTLYPDIKAALKSGGLLFVDELSARLHPLLHLNILSSFTDPTINRKGAQLIITSHDVSLLANNYLREDEIWIAEKDSDEESSLFSFFDFKDATKLKGNNGRSLLKNYLMGRLGGIPSLKSIEF
ncbi:MAG: ATP-binding protein [Thermoguttaceae bacterium]|nr:ATP-binding protein [Thermoguttaceae bacterium]